MRRSAKGNAPLARQTLTCATSTRITFIQLQKLHTNTIAGYWSTFRAMLHAAYRDHKIKENSNGFLDWIDTIPTEKERLSQPELVCLANTDCKEPVLKKAFLFSCLIGLRKSDVKALTWKKIQPYGDGGMYFTVRMQKTQQLVNNPVSEEVPNKLFWFNSFNCIYNYQGSVLY